MTDYLDSTFDLDLPEAVSAFDELTLWSSFSGALLLRHVPMTRNMRVLDVGCGTGFPLLELAGRLGASSHVTGVDVWDAALERARAKAVAYDVTNADIRNADAAALPFDDAVFDLIVSNLGLNNFSDARSAVSECARVLKPGGIIAITTNLVGHMWEFYDVLDSTLADMGETDARTALATHVAHRATIDGVRELFASAGLDTTAVHEETVSLRFADGSALLRHYLIRMGFLGAWKAVIGDAQRVGVFERLEANLNALAATAGEIVLTVPLAYIEARRPSG